MPIYYQLSTRNLPLFIESIGNHWNQENIQRNNGYPHFHWLQSEEGAGEIQINNKIIQLKKGEGIFIAPLTPHGYHRKTTEWFTSFVTLNGSLAEGINEIVGHEPYILAKETEDFSFKAWSDRIIALHNGGQLDSLQLSVDCYAFLMRIASFRDNSTSQQHPLYQRYVVPTIKQIETNYDKVLTVELLSQNVFVSPQYLSRLFQRFLGRSTYSYLMDFRMNRAKEILVNQPWLEIQQISFMVGFNDTSHFIVEFKKNTGHTPLEFRRQYR